MSGVSITGLNPASTLTGSEIVPIVQSGTTVRTTVADMGPVGAFTQSGTGAVTTTVQAKLRETVSVKDFGAVGDGVTDDTIAIQAAIDTGFDVVFPSASYKITAPLEIGSQRLFGGTGAKATNRPQTKIFPDGNFPAFVNKSGFPSFQIDGFYIYYGATVPTNSVTDGNKAGFYFTGLSSWPEVIQVSNCTVEGGWWAYYDDTGTYLSRIVQVIGRNCTRGFEKKSGTTILFDTCASSGGTSAFYVDNVLAAQLQNCACDNLQVSTNYSFASSGNLFVSVQSLVISGWDAEGCSITTDGGTDAALFRFVDTIGTISGFIGYTTSFATTGASGVNLFRAENNSRITILGCKDTISGTISYTGSGYPATLQTDSSSWISVDSSKFSAATGGSPVISTVATGSAIAFTNSLVTGINIGYEETKTSYGLKTPNVYTDRGTTAVTAATPTNVITLSGSTQAVYMMSIWNPNAGTTYMTTSLISFDGTNWVVTNVKAGANLILGMSGTTVQATSTTSTTLTWSIVRIA